MQLTGIGASPEATLRRLGESFPISPSQPFTIAGWFRSNQLGGTGIYYNYLWISLYDYDADEEATITLGISGYYQEYATQDLYVIAAVGMYTDTEEWIWSASDCSTTPASFSPTEDEWHFYCLYYDGNGLYLEVDNVAVGQALGQHPATGTASRIIIEIDWDPGGGVVSAVDELGIWTQALTSEQRSYLWNSGNGRTLYP